MEKLIVIIYNVFEPDEIFSDEYPVEDLQHAKDLANLLFRSYRVDPDTYTVNKYYFEDSNGMRRKFITLSNQNHIWLELR